jgi:hypothetical protein
MVTGGGRMRRASRAGSRGRRSRGHGSDSRSSGEGNSRHELPDYRPGESSEWVPAIHRLQDIVMSRAAVRAYPDKFTGLFVKTSPDDRR